MCSSFYLTKPTELRDNFDPLACPYEYKLGFMRGTCMASGTLLGDDGGTGVGAGDRRAAREKQRWTDKVYKRKYLKNNKTNTTNNIINTLPSIAINNEHTNHFVSQLPSLNQAFEPANSNEKRPISLINVALEDSSSLNPAQPEIPCSENSNNHVVFQPPSENLVSKLVNSKEKHPISCIDAALKESANLNPVQQVVASNGINNNQVVSEPPSQSLVSKPVNYREKYPISFNDAALGDSASLNPAQPVVQSNGVMKQGTLELENRIKINLASKSKQEIRDLKRNLENELNMVRSLVRRIETKDGPVSTVYTAAKYRVDDGGLKNLHPDVFSIGAPHGSSRPSYHVSIPLIENGLSVIENLEREKRTPKANQFYRNSEFLLANDKFPPLENKKSKSGAKKSGSGKMEHRIGMGKKFYKSSGALLERLMKHKHGWVFIEPVDPKALGLIDYFTVIKHPMDLGTIKSRLNSNWYKSPYEFAEDVRLTFRNAMTYNPVGQDVHTMAGQLAKIFEDKWVDIEAKYNRDLRYVLDYDAGLPTPTSRRAYPSQPPFRPPPFETRTLDRSEPLPYHVGSTMKPMNIAPPTRTPAPKKPKAKDPDKRLMTFEEKQKLSTNLQSLPSEKLDNIVQIIKKKNFALSQNDDEIEVDIDSVDNETLWELDRFVTNYKKCLSKYKRRAELAHQAREAAKRNDQDKIPASVIAEKTQESKTGEKNTSLSSPVRGETQGDNESSSSSSSSSSSGSDSSSSDSDSDSSSADGSDAEILPKT